MTFTYGTHRSKYQKCNRPYKLKHHKNIAWYFKAKFKTNPPRLETLKEEPCLHSFKYINYKGDY